MIHRLAEDIAFYFTKKHYIDIEDREIYEYGAEAFISNGLVFLFLLLISLASNNILYFICFILVFMPLRSCLGGYHASTQINCILLTISMYIGSIAINWYFVQENMIILIIAILVVADFIILSYGPLAKENSYLSKETIQKNAISARKILALDHIALILLIYGRWIQFFEYISLIIAIVALLLVIERTRKGGK